MLHVTHAVPATWRGGTIPAIAARLQLRERAALLYQQVTDGPGVLAGLRALGARVTGIFHKARSTTQIPSAWERQAEQIIALHAVHVPAHELRRFVVATESLIDDLEAREATQEDVLHAVEVAVMVEAKENEAEALLLCRADRELTEGDLTRLLEAKESEVAADRDVIAKCRRRLAVIRAQRRGITVSRGGMA